MADLHPANWVAVAVAVRAGLLLVIAGNAEASPYEPRGFGGLLPAARRRLRKTERAAVAGVAKCLSVLPCQRSPRRHRGAMNSARAAIREIPAITPPMMLIREGAVTQPNRAATAATAAKKRARMRGVSKRICNKRYCARKGQVHQITILFTRGSERDNGGPDYLQAHELGR